MGRPQHQFELLHFFVGCGSGSGGGKQRVLGKGSGGGYGHVLGTGSGDIYFLFKETRRNCVELVAFILL